MRNILSWRWQFDKVLLASVICFNCFYLLAYSSDFGRRQILLLFDTKGPEDATDMEVRVMDGFLFIYRSIQRTDEHFFGSTIHRIE
jgi:hypothetical protein